MKYKEFEILEDWDWDWDSCYLHTRNYRFKSFSTYVRR